MGGRWSAVNVAPLSVVRSSWKHPALEQSALFAITANVRGVPVTPVSNSGIGVDCGAFAAWAVVTIMEPINANAIATATQIRFTLAMVIAISTSLHILDPFADRVQCACPQFVEGFRPTIEYARRRMCRSALRHHRFATLRQTNRSQCDKNRRRTFAWTRIWSGQLDAVSIESSFKIRRSTSVGSFQILSRFKSTSSSMTLEYKSTSS